MTYSQINPAKAGGFTQNSQLKSFGKAESFKRSFALRNPLTNYHHSVGDNYGKIQTFQSSRTQAGKQDCDCEAGLPLQIQHQLSHHLDSEIQKTDTGRQGGRSA